VTGVAMYFIESKSCQESVAAPTMALGTEELFLAYQSIYLRRVIISLGS